MHFTTLLCKLFLTPPRDAQVLINTMTRYVQSTGREKLIGIGDSTNTIVTELKATNIKLDAIDSRGITLETSLQNNQTAIADILRYVREIQSSQSSQDSAGEIFFQRLMSRPDYLRGLLNAQSDSPSQPMEQEPRTSPRLHRWRHTITSCDCRYRQQLTREFARWTVFTRFDESIDDFLHERGCHRYSDDPVNQQHTIVVVCTALRRLLNIAVGVSLMWKTGAGGASISSGIGYYAVVDKNRSPAFRITQIMGKANWAFSSRQDTDASYSEAQANCRQIIRAGTKKIQQIFANKASSPTDVCDDGTSLIEGYIQNSISQLARTFKQINNLV
ncbi:uncharacterized protein F4822DRAFT_107877 [Hypoxylon trugodes]|uniref:uncharacterized protein n=1 Tax=Hypoxylon trugodes TaxID=326681 RepID=UPI0021A1639B|nr:uncharacterized protein F4822DRAFT_107877 [Hypoxylon trugodes]KAI1391873.1 hypothetical protein F4822DRAFT_107877 [Hypoxylon trugodes]